MPLIMISASLPAAEKRSVGLGMKRGAALRCPNCGEGHLYRKYLKVQVCEACGNDNTRYPADDAPPYFTILIVGHLTTKNSVGDILKHPIRAEGNVSGDTALFAVWWNKEDGDYPTHQGWAWYALGDALETLVTDSSKRKKMGEASRVEAGVRFEARENARRLFEFVRSRC